ncbi:hypothetical protein NUSPORA_02951, partial [Nucleospora cyclopteri]
DLFNEFLQKDNFDCDLLLLYEILQEKQPEKLRLVFYVEICAKVLKKHGDIKNFYTAVLKFLDANCSYKSAILVLRIIDAITNTRLYVPTSFYLITLLETAVDQKKLVSSYKKFTMENIRLSTDDIKTVELQLFVVEKVVFLLRKNLSIYSNSIGFPELSTTVEKELKNKCKKNEFKELIGDLIKEIQERRNFIEKKREETFKREEKIDSEKVKKFEGEIKKITF